MSIAINAEKNGTLIPVTFNDGTTVEQAISMLENHPSGSFSGAYQKYLTRTGVYVSSLVGANGVAGNLPLENNDKISFVSKVVGGN